MSQPTKPLEWPLNLEELAVLFEQMLQKSLDETNFDAAAACRAGLDNVRSAIKTAAVAASSTVDEDSAGPEPSTFATMYKTPEVKFTRDQLTFIVDVILSAVVDRLEASLPPSVREADWPSQEERIAFLGGVMVVADAALPILWAQLHDDGMGIGEYACREQWTDEVNYLVNTMIDGETLALTTEETLERLKSARPDATKTAERVVMHDYREYLTPKFAYRGKESSRWSSKNPPGSNTGKCKRDELEPRDGSLSSMEPLSSPGSLLSPFEIVLRQLDVVLHGHGERVQSQENWREEYQRGVVAGLRDARTLIKLLLLGFLEGGGDLGRLEEICQKIKSADFT
jgi:hypothetical protein